MTNQRYANHMMFEGIFCSAKYLQYRLKYEFFPSELNSTSLGLYDDVCLRLDACVKDIGEIGDREGYKPKEPCKPKSEGKIYTLMKDLEFAIRFARVQIEQLEKHGVSDLQEELPDAAQSLDMALTRIGYVKEENGIVIK